MPAGHPGAVQDLPVTHRHELLHTLWHLWGHPRSTRGQIVAFQERNRRYLLRHACENVRYYQDLFDRSNIKPGDIRTVRDLHSVPITSKKDLKACAVGDTLAPGAGTDGLLALSTSGSTGEPFVVYRAQFEDLVVRMFNIRFLRQLGLRVFDRHAIVEVGNALGETGNTMTGRLHRASHIFRRYPVDCLQPPGDICRRLAQLDPHAIIGYSSVLAHAAPLAEEIMPGGRVKFIVAGGDALTPARRRAIERGFGARVVDAFGAYECCMVATQCPETGLYHVYDDNAVVEVLRDGRPVAEGESGQVVVTALHCYAMPFIRYSLGDIVVRGPETCPCGQPFSTFESIRGRDHDYLSLPDGRRVHPLEALLPVISTNAPWLGQFQLIQETGARFVLAVVPMKKPGAGEMETMSRAIAERLGPEATVEIQLVEHIDFEPSGKFKDCKCLIAQERS